MLLSAALLICASSSFAEGEFQQAKDGKTLIWNGTPKPGETVTWDGDRDKENYAVGFGALTWYTANGTVYGLYYGNMVHGKLEGPVNVHINGRTAHAYFVDGGRVTGWGRGRAPSKMEVPEEVVAEKRRVQAEKEAAAAKRTAAAAEAEKKAKKQADKEAAENVQRPISEPSPASSSPPAVAEKRSEAPATSSPARAFDEPTPISTKSESKREPPSPNESEAGKSEVNASTESLPPALERPVTESPPASVQQTPPMTEEAPIEPKTEATAPTSEITRESSPTSTKRESPADVSLNSLVGPPSSLRTAPETSPRKMETETSTSTINAPLTETEAIDLADTEARIQGYHLDDYQRPKVDHSAVKGKWSLFYGSKEASAGESGGPFTVTVEDKTRKVEIRK
jgi:hypothetical protein